MRSRDKRARDLSALSTEVTAPPIDPRRQDVRVAEVPVPKITDPADVIIKITASGLCGSDLHLYNGAMPGMKKGDILGHEPMGIVEEVGPEVAKIKKGDRVVVAFDLGCGSCLYCKEVGWLGVLRLSAGYINNVVGYCEGWAD